MMKVNITHQDKFVSFEIESNLPEHEAFEVLRAFTISAFENVEEPLTFVFSDSDAPFRLQDPKDWKEGMQKYFKGVVNLTLLTSEDSSDSEDSFCVITEDGEVAEKEDQAPQNPEQAQEIVEELKSVEVIEDDNGVIEDYEGDDQNSQEKEEEMLEGKQDEEKPQPQQPRQLPCQQMKQRVMQFIADLGSENVQNIVAVAHMLLTEGCQIGDAIRTALDSSEAVSEHPFVKEFLPHLDMFVAQAGCFTKTLVPFITQIDIDGIIALIPNIVETITRALSGEQDVELDVAPIFQLMNPMMMQHMQNLIPNGQERVFNCDAFNPFRVIEDAREAVEQEFQPEEPAVVHRGITCDVCEMSPIVGVRYKSVLTANYDLCEACEPNHDPNDPLIKIKTPIGDMDLLPGLGEFSAAVGGHAMRRGMGGRRGGRRGRCGGRRRGCGRRNGPGCRRGPGPFRKLMREMMANNGGDCHQKMREMMQNGGCEKMREHMMQMREQMMQNGGCPMMRRFCNQQQENEAEQPQKLAEEFRADPAQAFAVEQARLEAEKAEKAKRLAEIEKKKIELAERKFQLAELRESMKKSKQELKAMKKEDKMHEKQFKQILKQTEQAKQLAKSTQPKCKEVTHLDLAETAVLKPGAQLKTWKVKNTGTTLWDDNTVAEFAKGNKSMIVAGFEKVHVGSVEPGHVAYIRVMLNIPEDAGDYSVTYRLSAPVTGRFGKPLRSCVTVEAFEEEFVDSPPVSALQDLDERTNSINSLPALIEDDVIDDIAEQVVEPEVTEPAFQYAEQLKALLEFGFPEEACKATLVASNGNLEAAINMLL